MSRSKYIKIIAIILGLLVLSGIGFYVFNHKNNIEFEQVANDNAIQETTVKEDVSKEDVLNPVQKYYKENLEQYEINFLNKAKNSKDNDLEFSKLQMKFIKATDVLNEKYAENIDIKDPYYKNNWIKLLNSEGSYYYIINYNYLYRKYGQYLSFAYKQLLNHHSETESIVEDAGLTISPDKLREYIIFLDNFIKQNPNFVLKNDVNDMLNNYLMIYLVGIDNSPTFDKWNTRKMLPKYKASYEKFLSENKDSKYYPMVEELYNKAKANDFSWDRDFDAWLYEYHKKYFAK
ncbi:hypothetical protein IKQ21_00615 [bacterium]|nr:hypothetical protein [bacterium]